MADLPTGNLTFLFTDIEGSTRLWEDAPEAMALAITRHTEIIVQSVEGAGGAVVRSRGEGDSTFSVFQNPVNAVNAACALQRSLYSENWPDGAPIRVRCAVHSGTGDVFGRDYNSSDVNRCARLRGIASGGQTLVSKATHDLVVGGLPDEISLRDLGMHRLKDLKRGEHVFQLCHADLPADYPPLRSLDSWPNNLPPQITSFVGREAEINELLTLLAETRLLTIMGIGGCGKTRISLQVAAQALEQFQDGVWFVELAQITDPSLVPHVAANALGVREEPGKSILQALSGYLADKSALIVLDNCEHLVEACAEMAHEFLSRCPGVKLLATSREALRVYGETTWRIPSLLLPEPTELQSPGDHLASDLAKYEAVALFLDRARSVNPRFELTKYNAEDVAQICRMLDGIPLALELAAARVKVLTVDKIARRLDDRFKLLTDGNRTAPSRQQTLRALIDWSYDLLSEEERIILARMSVFAGGCDLEAAEAVCDFGEGLNVLDLLSQLVDKSLVITEERGVTGRYRLLQTIRQYSREKLAEMGEEAAAIGRHSQYFASLADRAEPHFTGTEQVQWLGIIEAEHDNCRAVLERCKNSPLGARLGLSLAGALWRFWFIRGYFGEGRDWLKAFIERPENKSRNLLRARALMGEGRLAICLGENEPAAALLDEALSIQIKKKDKLGASVSLMSMGVLAAMKQDFELAQKVFEHGLSIQREIGDKRGTAISLSNLANVAIYHEDFVRARALLDESLALSREIADTQATATALNNLGHVASKQQDYSSARAYFTSSLALCNQLGYKSGIADCTEELAKLAVEQQDVERASVLFAVAGNLRVALNLPLPPAEQEVCDRHLAVVRSALPKETFETSWLEGAGMSIEEAVAFAMGEDIRGGVTEGT